MKVELIDLKQRFKHEEKTIMKIDFILIIRIERT